MYVYIYMYTYIHINTYTHMYLSSMYVHTRVTTDMIRMLHAPGHIRYTPACACMYITHTQSYAHASVHMPLNSYCLVVVLSYL